MIERDLFAQDNAFQANHTCLKASLIAWKARAVAQEQYSKAKHSTRLTPDGAAEKMNMLVRKAAEAATAEIKNDVLAEYRWTYDEMAAHSPVDFRTIAVHRHPPYLFSLFEPRDVIWCGQVYDAKERNFRTREEWLSTKDGLPPLTCPSTFNAGVYSRSQTNAVARRFLVVESDTLDRDTVGAIFRWLVQENSLKLRALVDTGGKSIHAWYSYPGENIAADLKLVLPTLGCDRRMFVPTQPCRMPGVGRNGRFQKLIYLSP